MKFQLPVFIFLLALSCTTAPEFNRSNANDPDSENYIPDPPKVVTGNGIVIDEQDRILLSWNITKYTDGTEIYKRYLEEDEFKLIAEIIGVDSSFVDSSGSYTHGTAYKIRNFRITNDSSKVYSQDDLNYQISFQPFRSINVYYDNGIRLNFSYPRDNDVGEVRKYDGIDFFVNEDTQAEIPEWKLLKSLSYNEIQNLSLPSTGVKSNLYDLHLKVSQFYEDSSGTHHELMNSEFHSFINPIQNASFQFTNELSGTFSWTHPITQRSNYIINVNQAPDTLFNSFAKSFEVHLPSSIPLPANITIQPYIGNNFGRVTRINTPTLWLDQPEFTKVTSISDQSFSFDWDSWTNEPDYVSNFIVEAKVNNAGEYSVLDTLPGESRSFTLSDANTNNTYQISVHSHRSEWAEPWSVSFQKGFSLTSSVELRFTGHLLSYSKNKTFKTWLTLPEIAYNAAGLISLQNQNTGVTYFHEVPVYDYFRYPHVDYITYSETDSNLIYLGDNHEVDIAGDYLSVFNIHSNEYNIEYYQLPGHGHSGYGLLSDDRTIAIVIYDHSYANPYLLLLNTKTGRELDRIITNNYGSWIIQEFNDTAYFCSESGIFEYQLPAGTISQTINTPCTNAQLNNDGKNLTFLSFNGFKNLDLDSFTVRDLDAGKNSPPLFDIYNYWYFPEDNIFIFREGYFNTYRITDQETGISSFFEIPVLDAEKTSSTIQSFKRTEAGTYLIVTNEGEFTFEVNNRWSRVLN